MANIVRKTTPEQLGFDIFTAVREQLGPDSAITESPRDIGYRKTNVLIDVTTLSLLARRTINALWLEVSERPDQTHYDLDLGYFKWLAKYEKSNNITHLKKVLRECQQSSVQVTVEGTKGGDPQWASIPLLGPVAIAGGRITFKVDEMIHRQLKDPQRYTYLSLRMSAALFSYAYILYERLSSLRFMGTTEWIPLDEIRRWVNADSVKSLTEYKEFKRQVLDKGIKQINELTDLHVEFETKNAQGSRRVAALRFKLRDNAAGKLVLDFNSPHELKDLYETLVKGFGLSKKHLDELVENRDEYTDERIKAAIELTRFRVKSGKVKAPAMYLMKAIRDNLRLSDIEMQMANASAPKLAVAEPVAETTEAQRQLTKTAESEAEAGIAAYLNLGEDARARVRKALQKEATFKIAAKRVKIKAVPDELEILGHSALRLELGSFMSRASTAELVC
jgi:hypothetical protein